MPETDPEPFPDDASCAAGRAGCGLRCAVPPEPVAPLVFLREGWLDDAGDFAGDGLAAAGLAAAGLVPVAAGLLPAAAGLLPAAAGFVPAAGRAPLAGFAAPDLAVAGWAAPGLAAPVLAAAGLAAVPGFAGAGRFTASLAGLGADGLRATCLPPDTSPAAVAGLTDTVGEVPVAVAVAGTVGG